MQEIQAQRPSLLVVEEAEVPLLPMDITQRLSSTSNTCSSLQAGPSPDEAVIVARGRRSLPLTFSPDVRVSPVTRTRPATVVSSRLMLPATRWVLASQVSSPPHPHTPLPQVLAQEEAAAAGQPALAPGPGSRGLQPLLALAGQAAPLPRGQAGAGVRGPGPGGGAEPGGRHQGSEPRAADGAGGLAAGPPPAPRPGGGRPPAHTRPLTS